MKYEIDDGVEIGPFLLKNHRLFTKTISHGVYSFIHSPGKPPEDLPPYENKDTIYIGKFGGKDAFRYDLKNRAYMKGCFSTPSEDRMEAHLRKMRFVDQEKMNELEEKYRTFHDSRIDLNDVWVVITTPPIDMEHNRILRFLLVTEQIYTEKYNRKFGIDPFMCRDGNTKSNRIDGSYSKSILTDIRTLWD